MKSSNKGKDFCVFALPGLFCFLAVVMVPFIYGIYLTLTDWNGVSSVKNLCRTFQLRSRYARRAVLEIPAVNL